MLAIARPEPPLPGIWAANENPNQAKAGCAAQARPAGRAFWTGSARISRAGLLHVTPELSEQYTPQLLHYDISGVIDFLQGLLPPARRVVARMYYRGKAKKRLHLFQSDQAISSAAEESTSE